MVIGDSYIPSWMGGQETTPQNRKKSSRDFTASCVFWNGLSCTSASSKATLSSKPSLS